VNKLGSTFLVIRYKQRWSNEFSIAVFDTKNRLSRGFNKAERASLITLGFIEKSQQDNYYYSYNFSNCAQQCREAWFFQVPGSFPSVALCS
jgi:hypothetical protein